jgi:hypothetical protein
MLKFRYETSMDRNYESVYASCPGRGRLGDPESTPVKHKHMLFPPACSSLLITEDLPDSWPGRYMRMDFGQPLTTQSLRYHSLFGTISIRLHTA